MTSQLVAAQTELCQLLHVSRATVDVEGPVLVIRLRAVDQAKLLQPAQMDAVAAAMKRRGFLYITLDLEPLPE